jgi:hypothetical protein
MMTEEAIKLLTGAIDGSNAQSTDLVTTRMVAFFEGTSPRVYCPDSPAFGHLSNTLAILKRFIALGFISKAEIVYQNADVLTKLRTLLPQIPQDPPFQILVSTVGKTALVTLTLMPKQTPLEPTEKFAITGGWDHPDDAKPVAALLNVDCLVAVQPYLWELTEPKAYDCAYFRRTDTMVKLTDLIPDLGQMLYLRPQPAVSAEEWSQLAALPNMDVKIPAAKAVVDGVNAGGLLFCPAYGISNVGTKVPASAPSPSSVLFNVCSTIRFLQVNGSQRFRKGAVILVLTELSSSAWTFLKGWVTGKSLFEPPETLKNFIAQYLYPQGVETVLVREKLETATEISQAIANLSSGQVLILNIQSLPSDVFELCYGMATLPSILEGAGTAGLVMNFRTPYFRFNGQGYPVFPFGSQPSPESLLAASRRDLVNTLLKAWSIASNEVPPPVLGQYFEDCYTTGSSIQSYFAQFATILQDPGNDKFFAALRMVFVCDAFQKNFQQLISAAPMRLAIAAGDPVLDEVYQKLESNLSGGTLNVVPGAFSQGQIAALYKTIAAGGIFTVTKATVTPPSNGEVLVTGSTDSLLGFPGLDVNLVFTDGELGLTSTLQIGRSDVSWNLLNVPWFALSAPRFDIVQTDNEAPTSGAVGSSIRLGDTTADVSLALPIQLDRWAFEATLTGTQPSIASVFQLVRRWRSCTTVQRTRSDTSAFRLAPPVPGRCSATSPSADSRSPRW